jgi:hypothetical protein
MEDCVGQLRTAVSQDINDATEAGKLTSETAAVDVGAISKHVNLAGGARVNLSEICSSAYWQTVVDSG